MRVFVEDGLYKGFHITGPTHNYLGVKFGSANRDLVIEVLPSIGSCNHGAGLAQDEVRPWIEEGFRVAEREVGQAFRIEKVEIVENDSRRPEVYQELARRIIIKRNEEVSSS